MHVWVGAILHCILTLSNVQISNRIFIKMQLICSIGRWKCNYILIKNGSKFQRA